MTITTPLSFEDELLAKLDSLAESKYQCKALREVVALHTAKRTGIPGRGKSGLRPRCTECGFAYPCPTIETIASNIQGVE